MSASIRRKLARSRSAWRSCPALAPSRRSIMSAIGHRVGVFAVHDHLDEGGRHRHPGLAAGAFGDAT